MWALDEMSSILFPGISLAGRLRLEEGEVQSGRVALVDQHFMYLYG